MILPHIKNQQSRDGNQGPIVSVELSGDDATRGKWLHDLHAAVEAFRFLIEITEENNANPTERDQTKVRQLKRHAERLKDGVQTISNIMKQAQ